MVLVYLPTLKGDFVRANVGKYSSTMEHMGMGIWAEYEKRLGYQTSGADLVVNSTYEVG